MKRQWFAAPALAAILMAPVAATGSEEFYNSFGQHSDLVREIPTTSTARAKEIFLKMAPDATEISSQLIPFITRDTDENTTARLALSGLAQNVGLAGSAAHMKELAEAFVTGLGTTDDPDAKSLLMELLVWIGDESVAPALAPYLQDERLAYRAARTLVQLNPAPIDSIFSEALEQESAANKAQILLVMDYLPARRLPVNKIATLAQSDDNTLRKAALDLLATAGAADALPALKGSLDNAQGALDQSYAFARVTRWITAAENVAQSKRRDIAVELLNSSAETSATGQFAQAAEALREVNSNAAITELQKWLTDDREGIRNAALHSLLEIRSSTALRAITSTLQNTNEPEVAIDMLRALGRSGNKSIISAAEKAIDHENPEVRKAAILAGGQIDRNRMAARLVKLLAEGNKEIQDTVFAELSRIRTQGIGAEVARSFASATDEGKVAVLEWLASRGLTRQRETIYKAVASDVAPVRSAAYKALEGVADTSDLERLLGLLDSTEKESERVAVRKAFVTVARRLEKPTDASSLLLNKFDDATLESQLQLLPVLSTLSSSDTLELVVKNARTSETPELQDAAVRALASWESVEAVEPLIAIAGKGNENKHQVLAYRGILRLAPKIEPVEKRLDLLKKIRNLATNDEDRQRLIGTLAEIRNLKSMKVIFPFVMNENTRSEAALALHQMTSGRGRVEGLDAASMLKVAIPHIDDKEKQKAAADFVNRYELEAETKALAPADGEGFHPLFNGENLDGWVGDTDGYTARDGALVCIKESGGNLMTERQFSDFVLRFEFALQENGNNGVAIRSTLNADAAYSGMEIQILDNNGPDYKDIKPWQRHGSVYGIAPAGDTEFKPYGEWNTEEIRVDGTKITVTVNGKVVTEHDLVDSYENTADGKPHPGMRRNRGHIGFLGHGHEVKFRNIRIKPIAMETPEGYTNLLESGKELSEWKAAPPNPVKYNALSEAERAAKDAEGEKGMREQWSVNELNELIHHGKTPSLATKKEYKDFELLAEWALGPWGDSAFYIRNTPQVQIWDPQQWDGVGSGGLYNNQKSTSLPLELADRPLGQWNQFKIIIQGETVIVDLNGKRVVDGIKLENFWDRDSPLLPTGNIEIQSHQSPVYLRNIFVRELDGNAAATESADAETTAADSATSPTE